MSTGFLIRGGGQSRYEPASVFGFRRRGVCRKPLVLVRTLPQFRLRGRTEARKHQLHRQRYRWRLFCFAQRILRGQPDFHGMRPAVQTVSRNQYAPFYFSGGGDGSGLSPGGKSLFWKSANLILTGALRQLGCASAFRHSAGDIAWVAQLVEHVLGKDEVAGSIPVPGSPHFEISALHQAQIKSCAELSNRSSSLSRFTRSVSRNPKLMTLWVPAH